MGRPPKKDAEKKARLSITIRPELMKSVEILAEREHRTISGTIEAALSEYVNARKSITKKVDDRKRNT
jgi:predicted transcriptional regulator